MFAPALPSTAEMCCMCEHHYRLTTVRVAHSTPLFLVTLKPRRVTSVSKYQTPDNPSQQSRQNSCMAVLCVACCAGICFHVVNTRGHQDVFPGVDYTQAVARRSTQHTAATCSSSSYLPAQCYHTHVISCYVTRYITLTTAGWLFCMPLNRADTIGRW
jgi:hypothetical protein